MGGRIVQPGSTPFGSSAPFLSSTSVSFEVYQAFHAAALAYYMTPIIIPATDAHAVAIAPRLRLADALELRRATAMPAIDVVRKSLALSLQAWTWMLEDRPACIFGVGGNLIGDGAMLWLLTTDDVARHPVTFWRHSRAIVGVMRECHPRLSGFCDSRYGATVRWLTRLGFALEGPMPFGEFNMPFYRFTMER